MYTYPILTINCLQLLLGETLILIHDFPFDIIIECGFMRKGNMLLILGWGGLRSPLSRLHTIDLHASTFWLNIWLTPSFSLPKTQTDKQVVLPAKIQEWPLLFKAIDCVDRSDVSDTDSGSRELGSIKTRPEKQSDGLRHGVSAMRWKCYLFYRYSSRQRKGCK